MQLYLRTIQAVCHLHQHLQNDPEFNMSNKDYLLVWTYWMHGYWDFSFPNEIHCGDILTTDDNGNILTVNGQEYAHTH
jgi:hypothetical protein